MKNFTYACMLISALVVAGCSAPTRPPVARAKILSSPKLTDKAKFGMQNADITRNIELTHRLPNGQPIPGYTGPSVGTNPQQAQAKSGKHT